MGKELASILTSGKSEIIAPTTKDPKSAGEIERKASKQAAVAAAKKSKTREKGGQTTFSRGMGMKAKLGQ